MYLHIGSDMIVPYKDIIAIIDLNSSGRSAGTKDFLKKNGHKSIKDNKVKKYKSCVITIEKIYYSTISSITLQKRTTDKILTLF